MSTADSFLTPAAAHANLEHRYRRLLRLYPREFRSRHETEMLGVLMESAPDGQNKPASGETADIVRGALLMRLRGPRGGWHSAMAAFALLAPLFLLLIDVLQVAFPYRESEVNWDMGGVELLRQPSFLLLVAWHLIVAVAVLAGLRRTALAAMLIAVAAVVVDSTHGGNSFGSFIRTGGFAVPIFTAVVFLFELLALAVSDPRAARHRSSWRYAAPILLLATAFQIWALAFDAMQDPAESSAHTDVRIGLVLVVIALLSLALGLGWRASLLFAAATYPFALIFVFMTSAPLSNALTALSRLANPYLPDPGTLLVIWVAPSLLVLLWGAAQSVRLTRSRRRRNLAA